MTEIIEWTLFAIICVGVLILAFFDEFCRLLVKIKPFFIDLFSAKSCRRKMRKIRLARKRKERSLIKECINDFMKRGETDIRMGISYEDNLKWLKKRGFKVELDNDELYHHIYCISWGEDNANK